MPGTNSSTSTFSSWRQASATAASSSPSAPHLRDADRGAEPRGLHEHRVAERVRDRVTEPQRDVAGHRYPLRPHHLLEDVLVHAQRRGEHARPDVGDVRELEQALHGAVLAERAVKRDEDDVERRRAWRASRRRARAASPRRLRAARGCRRRGGAPSGRHGRSRSCARRSARGRAPSAIEAAEASEMSCSLERPPASTATRRRGLTGRWRRPRPSRSWSSRRRPVATYRHTSIATVESGSACVKPSGLCEATSPSSDSSSVSEVVTVTLNPAARSVCRAAARSRPVTSGTSTVVGPFDTDSVTVDRLRGGGVARRILRDHGPLRLVARRRRVARDCELRRLELRGGRLVQEPDDRRHADGLRALGDVDAHLGARHERRARLRAPAPSRCPPAATGVDLHRVDLETGSRDLRDRVGLRLAVDARHPHLALARSRRARSRGCPWRVASRARAAASKTYPSATSSSGSMRDARLEAVLGDVRRPPATPGCRGSRCTATGLLGVDLLLDAVVEEPAGDGERDHGCRRCEQPRPHAAAA